MSTSNSTELRKCCGCGRQLPATEEHFYVFPSRVSGRNPLGLSYRCRECEKGYYRNWHKKNPGRHKQVCRDFAARHPGLERERAIRRRRILKAQVLLAYSPGIPRCACCEETAFEFLTIDHPNGDGAAHRKKVGATRVYLDLKRRGFPPGHRVLCMNCNFAIGKFGYCPHRGGGFDIRSLEKSSDGKRQGKWRRPRCEAAPNHPCS